MIGQYLSNKNKSATVAKSEFFSELNEQIEWASLPAGQGWSMLDDELIINKHIVLAIYSS